MRQGDIQTQAQRAPGLNESRRRANRTARAEVTRYFTRKRGRPPGTAVSDDPRLRAFIALLVTLGLVVGGVFLTRELRSAAQLQDCVMSGRTNCAPIDPQLAERTR